MDRNGQTAKFEINRAHRRKSMVNQRECLVTVPLGQWVFLYWQVPTETIGIQSPVQLYYTL